jgi:hypothetical protein
MINFFEDQTARQKRIKGILKIYGDALVTKNGGQAVFFGLQYLNLDIQNTKSK